MLNQFYSSNIYVHVLSALLGMKDMQMVFAWGMIFNTLPVNTTSNLSASSSLKIYLRSVHFFAFLWLIKSKTLFSLLGFPQSPSNYSFSSLSTLLFILHMAVWVMKKKKNSPGILLLLCLKWVKSFPLHQEGNSNFLPRCSGLCMLSAAYLSTPI